MFVEFPGAPGQELPQCVHRQISRGPHQAASQAGIRLLLWTALFTSNAELRSHVTLQLSQDEGCVHYNLVSCIISRIQIGLQCTLLEIPIDFVWVVDELRVSKHGEGQSACGAAIRAR